MQIRAKKQCRVCRQVKPASEFGKNRTTRDGLDYLCKDCSRAAALQSYYRHRARRMETSRKWKAENPEKNAQTQHDYRLAHTAPRHSQARAWREKNKEYVAAYGRTWRERNAAHLATYNNAYRERGKVIHRAWVQRNRDKVRAKDRRRYRRLIAGGPSFTDAEWAELRGATGNRCLSCGRTDHLTPDHVVPVVKRGLNSIDNIQPLCIECNQKKGVKVIDYRI